MPPAPFRLVRDLEPLPPELRRPVLAIGNFDGVHRGHHAVIDRAKALGARLGRPAGVLTFEPHPVAFFRPQEPMFLLTPEPLHGRLIALAGADLMVVLTFDRQLAATTAEAFASDILVGRLAVSGVVVGYDFHFGRGRAGSPRTLMEAGSRHGFPVEVVSPLSDGTVPVSATAIRAALARGAVEEAAHMIGHRWCVRGVVAHGDKRGRLLGFPTANLALEPGNGLMHGIYAVRAAVEGRIVEGVASFGRRPTFDDGAPRLEVFLFDFAGDLYGKPMVVEFAGFIRGEEKFETVEALVERMRVDCEAARGMLVERAGEASVLRDLAE